jgi:hypothetical protein
MFSSPLAVALALAILAGQSAPAPEVAGAAAPADAAEYLHLGATPPPHGLPEIRSVSLSTTDLRAGHAVTSSVLTSENVDYVEARINYYNAPMHREGPGRFSLTYRVPWYLPPWLRHAYTLQVIARSVDGVETVRGIGIRVR